MGPGGVDLVSYRLSIGSWCASTANSLSFVRRRTRSPASAAPKSIAIGVFYLFLLLRATTLIQHGGVERNPGPLPIGHGDSPSASTSIETSRGGCGSDSNSNSNVNFRLRPRAPQCQAATASTPSARGLCPPASDSVSVVFGNARSVFPKLQELALRVDNLKPDMIGITESWLRCSDLDGALTIDGYSLHRRDRQDLRPGSNVVRRGGGVAVWVHHRLKCTRRPDLELWPEDLWLELPASSGHNVLFGCVYRPPDKCIDD